MYTDFNLFKYFYIKLKSLLVRFIFIEYLSFNFRFKCIFDGFYRESLNLTEKRVSQTTFTRIFKKLVR